MSGPAPSAKLTGSSGDLADLLSDRADLYHILVAADIEGLVVDDLARRLEQGEKRSGNVLHVHQRSPRAAVGLEPYAALGEGGSGQVVDHDVGAQPRRGSVRRGVSQIGRTEVVVRELRKPSSAIALLSPYGVTGLNLPVSSTGLSPAAP